MELNLIRDTFTAQCTIGKIFIDGTPFCDTLEDVVRPIKIPKETAIPAGRYRIEITPSPKFGRDMPRLLAVPNFEGILIHAGNQAKDTEGCILVGSGRTADSILNSRDTFNRLFPKLQAAAAQERLWISISERGRPADLGPAFEVGARVRVRIDAAPVMRRGEIVLLAAHGSELEVTAGSQADGTVPVSGFDEDGEKVAGTVTAGALEAVPLDDEGDSDPAQEWRVNATALYLRSKPGVMTDDSVIARLPQGQLVHKLAAAQPLPWWKVRTVVGRATLTGYCHSGYLLPATEVPSAARTSSGQGGVQLSERALALIIDAESNGQPSQWPGGDSGITIGFGYDLGYQTVDRFRGDWGAQLPAPHVDLLSTAIGLRGARARSAAPNFAQIRIPRNAAEVVFQRCSVPRMRAEALRTFPGILDLPIDAQGALVSLVFNRGTDMGDPADPQDRRAEMRQIRTTVGNPSLPMDEKLRNISASLRSMKRLWEGKGLGGLLRRREDEARLVESCLA